MNQFIYSSFEISKLVTKAIDKKGWSIRECCNLFNIKYSEAILLNEITQLDKDFVQRVKNNNFKVISDRVVKLCEFLNINIEAKQSEKNLFAKEFSRFNEIVKSKPELEVKVKKLLTNVVDVISLGNK